MKIQTDRFPFICGVIAGLISCTLGYDRYPFPTFEIVTKNPIVEEAQSSFIIAVIVVAVINVICLIFGICMIVFFGGKKVTHGKVLSTPQQQQPQQQGAGIPLQSQEIGMEPIPPATQDADSNRLLKEAPPPTYYSKSNF